MSPVAPAPGHSRKRWWQGGQGARPAGLRLRQQQRGGQGAQTARPGGVPNASVCICGHRVHSVVAAAFVAAWSRLSISNRSHCGAGSRTLQPATTVIALTVCSPQARRPVAWHYLYLCSTYIFALSVAWQYLYLCSTWSLLPAISNRFPVVEQVV